jgi:hypothetical protein
MPYEPIFGTRWKWSFAAQRSPVSGSDLGALQQDREPEPGTRLCAYEGHRRRRSVAVCVLRPPASHWSATPQDRRNTEAKDGTPSAAPRSACEFRRPWCRTCVLRSRRVRSVPQNRSGRRILTVDLSGGFDAIVVGSGFGGSVTVARLAQAGLRVAILERGRRWSRGSFPRDSTDLKAGWLWHVGSGLFDLRWLDRMLSVQAAGWGGGSLIYANVFA